MSPQKTIRAAKLPRAWSGVPFATVRAPANHGLSDHDIPLRERKHTHMRPWSWVLATALTGLLAPGLAAAQDSSGEGYSGMSSGNAPRPWTATAGNRQVSADAQEAADEKAEDATSPWDVTIGLGAAVRPTYEGSDEYEAIPAPWVDITYGDWISFSPDGLNAYWHTGNLRIGGGVTSISGRNDSDSGEIFDRGDDRLKGMGDLSSSTAARAFVAYQWGMVNLGVSAEHSVESSDEDDLTVEGSVVQFGASIPFQVTDNLTFTAALGATWADDKYMQSLFGVTAKQAERSQFTQYTAVSGLKSVGIAFGASYKLSNHWSLMALVHGEKLMGDAADSPIVFSDTNATFITTVNYHF